MGESSTQAGFHRFRKTVRYRLLILTSAPILLTMGALLVLSIYWTTHYTWQNALDEVSERLRVARNSVGFLLSEQELTLNSIARSYQFTTLITYRPSNSDINQWLCNEMSNSSLDFAYFEDAGTSAINAQHIGSNFEIVSRERLEQLNPMLPGRAEITIVDSGEKETRALIAKTVVPVYGEKHQLKGYLIGGNLLNRSSELVDKIRDLIYPSTGDADRPHGSVTLFLDGLRVSTNVALSHGEHQGDRAIGTRVSPEVYQQVIVNGQEWVNLAHVLDRWHISAYQPIRNAEKEVIGMLYTGYPVWPLFSTYIINIIQLAFIAIFMLTVSGLFVYRSSRSLFKPIEKMDNVVRKIQRGEPARMGPLELSPGNELSQLAGQFDVMLDTLEQQQQEILSFAKSLENKVAERTVSLQEKTTQLEEYIRLLKQTRHKLVAKEKFAALGELTAGIAHEINNPIAVILGNAELIRLLIQQGKNDFTEELDAIYKQVDRIRDITRSLLQYSRKQDCRECRGELQNINPIIKESITLVRTGENKRNIHYSVYLDAKNRVFVNRHQLLQVLVNLQINAIQAMDGCGEIQITSEDRKCDEGTDGVLITVTDHGKGIDSLHINKIFDPFFTTKQEGTGIGLSVSRNLIDQMGGEILVESAPEKGTSFTIFLPAFS